MEVGRHAHLRRAPRRPAEIVCPERLRVLCLHALCFVEPPWAYSVCQRPSILEANRASAARPLPSLRSAVDVRNAPDGVTGRGSFHEQRAVAVEVLPGAAAIAGNVSFV